jgi:hypothetical protein
MVRDSKETFRSFQPQLEHVVAQLLEVHRADCSTVVGVGRERNAPIYKQASGGLRCLRLVRCDDLRQPR